MYDNNIVFCFALCMFIYCTVEYRLYNVEYTLYNSYAIRVKLQNRFIVRNMKEMPTLVQSSEYNSTT